MLTEFLISLADVFSSGIEVSSKEGSSLNCASEARSSSVILLSSSDTSISSEASIGTNSSEISSVLAADAGMQSLIAKATARIKDENVFFYGLFLSIFLKYRCEIHICITSASGI